MQFNLNLENINYIKIVYKDKEDNTRYIKASIKRMNEREIFASAKFEDELNIHAPQDVSASFVCENGLYRTTTQLKYVEYTEPYIFLILQTPQGLEYQQNREYFRVRIEENIILRFAETVIPCKTYDISANGVRVVIDKDLQIPDIVDLDILFNSKNIKTKAQYIRTDNEDKIWKASFTFINLAESDVDFIAKKCIQLQLSNRRNSI